MAELRREPRPRYRRDRTSCNTHSADGRQCSRWLQPADTRAESLLMEALLVGRRPARPGHERQSSGISFFFAIGAAHCRRLRADRKL